MTEGQEIRTSREEVEGFVGKLRDFHSSLEESERAMMDAVLGSAQGETGGYRRKMGRSGEGSEETWNDLIGWIEEQGEEDTQGFGFRKFG